MRANHRIPFLPATIFALAFLLLLTAVSQAAPSTITIQGKLTNASGKALTGSRAWRVQFYDAATGGNALGGALTGKVAIPVSGRFSIEVTPPAAALAAAAPYYQLAIDSAATPDGAIGNNDIFPNRIKVTSVMYAQKLARQGAGSGVDADTLDGSHASDFATNTSLASQLAAHTMAWQTVSANTQMQANAGYLANNPTNMVALTLPTTPAIGDIVRISGLGGGGWKVVSPMIGTFPLSSYPFTIKLNGLNLTDNDSGVPILTDKDLSIVAISPDGQLVAAASGDCMSIKQSGDFSWTTYMGSSHNWSGIAIANGGAAMAACANDYIYTSINRGLTWSPQQTDTARSWTGVAISPDGIRLAACVYSGGIYTSNNGGANWTLRVNAGNYLWRKIAISSDGTHLAATHDKQIALSSDGGATWREQAIPDCRTPTGLAMSADAKHLAVCDFGYGLLDGGLLSVSHDGGATWNTISQVGRYGWRGIAITDDGQRLVACCDSSYGRVVVSEDGGLTWNTRPGQVNTAWESIAISADGATVVAGKESAGGWLATLKPRTTQTGIFPSGFVSGGAGSALELQYIGNNTYLPLSSNGVLNAQ